MPTLSIGMPVYNSGELLEPAVLDLLGQSFSDFELILSDNGSTDGTWDRVRALATRDSRIRTFRQPENIGPFRNFDFVLHQAQSRFFMWAADDDRRAPDFIARLIERFHANPLTGLAFCHYVNVDLTTGGKSHVFEPKPTSVFRKFEALRDRLYVLHPQLIYGIFRRAALLRVWPAAYFDWADVYVGAAMSVCADVEIVPSILFEYGVKTVVRKPTAANGIRMEIAPCAEALEALAYQIYPRTEFVFPGTNGVVADHRNVLLTIIREQTAKMELFSRTVEQQYEDYVRQLARESAGNSVAAGT